MKISLSLICCLFISLNNFAQSAKRTYYGNPTTEFIEFVNDKEISFLIHVDGCLGGMYYSGQGLYKIKNGVLKVKVLSHDKSLESYSKVIKDSTINSGCIIKGHVLTENGDPLPGVTIIYQIGKKIDGIMTDYKGYFFKEIKGLHISNIKVTYVGYRYCNIFPLDYKMTEYQIIMKEPYYDFLDNQTLKGKLMLDEKTNKFSIDKIKINNWL